MTEKKALEKMTEEEEKKIFIVCRKLEEIVQELQELNEKIFVRMTLKGDVRIPLTEVKVFAKEIGIDMFYQFNPFEKTLYFANKRMKRTAYLRYY